MGDCLVAGTAVPVESFAAAAGTEVVEADEEAARAQRGRRRPLRATEVASLCIVVTVGG